MANKWYSKFLVNDGSSSKQLQFDGIFQGRESEIRITPDNKISVFDFIKVAGGQTKPKNVWYDIENKYKNEVAFFSGHFQFPGAGQRLTPVIDVRGMVKLFKLDTCISTFIFKLT